MSDDKSRARLGRGLASLIGGGGTAGFGGPRASIPLANVSSAAAASERRIPVDRLRANPRNPRKHFVEADLADLTASVRQHGVVQPILVRPAAAESGSALFEIVAGERRWRAARAAGLADVPVVVREIDDRQSLEIAIIENVQRADLNAVEEARGYEALIGEFGYTQSDLADILGKSRSHVANTLRLLKLPASVQELVESGELTPGAARTAVSQDDPEAFARRIVDGGLSVREAEERARADAPPSGRGTRGRGRSGAKAVTTPAGGKDADTAALEQLLTDALSMPVRIELKGKGGRLALDFTDLDQLDELCRLLQARRRRDGSTGEGGPRISTL